MSAAPNSENQDQQASSSTSSILKERRFKLSRACDRCRRRRIKCDEGHPCQACLAANSACTFEEPGKRTHTHKSKRTTTLEDRMHHLETLIAAIPPAVFAGIGAPVPPQSLAFDPNTGITAPQGQTAPTSPVSTSHAYPPAVPPPSLHVFPLTNPSTYFPSQGENIASPNTTFSTLFGLSGLQAASPQFNGTVDTLAEETSKMSLSDSYLYFDDEGYTRWQGETSGLPLLDLLVERHSQTNSQNNDRDDNAMKTEAAFPGIKEQTADWFPDRTPKRTDANPETLWRLITSYIQPELMDSLVQCYLSTSYYILPFLHVPTFLADYGNPQKWGEPGFAAFIVSVCCLASRHMNDPRVRADPEDGISAGTQWFELLGRLRTLPIADRPTLYTIQADLIAGVYAVGLGKLSKAAALLSEAVTTSVDAGLHRSADTYDLFDPIEDEVRKRTFWCVYIWDKQLCAHFGRPPMIRLRDCDVAEPLPLDDEFITKDGVSTPPPGTESRLSAFVILLRMTVVLESVLDVSPSRNLGDNSSFLTRASSVLARGRRNHEMKEEEALLDEIHQIIPAYWAHSPETLGSEDPIRVTQAERLHCAENFVRLLIYRHRFSELFAERTGTDVKEDEQSDVEKQAMTAAYHCALQIVSTHLSIATKGLMTYYGVHVIHQLTQAGRTLVAILLNCKSDSLLHLIPSALDALRSCVGLLRRFSGRYICGLRSGDLMEEFCRITQIPLEPHGGKPDNGPLNASKPRLPWIRPVRKKASVAGRPRSSTTEGRSQAGSSPERFSPDFFNDLGSQNPVSTPSPNSAPQGPSSNASSTHQGGPTSPIVSMQQYAHATPNANVNVLNGQVPPGYGDASGAGLSPASMYMSQDMMSMFNENGVDVASLFNSDLLGQQHRGETV